MRSPGRVFTRAQIIDAAFGPDFDGFDRTVDTHIWSLRRKLHDRQDERRLILCEPGIGYRLAESDGA
jgi:DNA-binding response OmpR family regulator